MKALSNYTVPGIVASLFVFLLPFVTSRDLFFGAVHAKYFFVVGVVSIALLFFSYLLFTQKHTLFFRKRWLLLLTGIFLSTLYLSSFLGVYPERSFFSDLTRGSGVVFLTYIAALALLCGELLRERDWSLVRWAIASSGALLGFFIMLGGEGIGLSGRILTINLEIPGLTLGNSTFAGAYLFIALAFTVIEFFRTESRRAKAVLGVLLLFQFLSPLIVNFSIWTGEISLLELVANPFLLVGTARASSVVVVALIAYVVGLLLIRRFVSEKPLANGLWAGAWILAITASLALLFVPGSAVQDRYIEESTGARIVVWESAFEATKEYTLFGWGPENFRFAFEQHFDNRLYQDEFLGEVWFDRAHNLFLDTLVSVGIVGFLVYVLLTLFFIAVALRASRAGMVTSLEANILGALIVGHILQLQTSFDTVATYTLMALVLGYGLWLERRMSIDESKRGSFIMQKIWAGVLAIIVIVALFPFVFGEYTRQKALADIFRTTNHEEQLMLIDQAFTGTSDIEALRFASASLVRGLLATIAESGGTVDEQSQQATMEQLGIYEALWRSYVENNSTDYRARMNFAYILLVETALGNDRLEEAKEVIAGSFVLSPENPLTFVLDGVATLYSGDVVGAQEKIEQAVLLNPNAPFSQEMQAYMDRQAATFPTVTILRLENL